MCKHLKLKTDHFVEVVSPVNISNVEPNKLLTHSLFDNQSYSLCILIVLLFFVHTLFSPSL